MGTEEGYLTIGVKVAGPICIMVIDKYFLLLISFVIYSNQIQNDNKNIKKINTKCIAQRKLKNNVL